MLGTFQQVKGTEPSQQQTVQTHRGFSKACVRGWQDLLKHRISRSALQEREAASSICDPKRVAVSQEGAGGAGSSCASRRSSTWGSAAQEAGLSLGYER